MSEEISPIGIVGGPSQVQIDEWKVKFGEIYVVKFSETEKYIYRPMRRFEYKQIVAMGQSENKSFAEEKIAQMCIVWPTIDPTKLTTLKAGTVSTIVDLVMSSSNFGVAEEPIKL